MRQTTRFYAGLLGPILVAAALCACDDPAVAPGAIGRPCTSNDACNGLQCIDGKCVDGVRDAGLGDDTSLDPDTGPDPDGGDPDPDGGNDECRCNLASVETYHCEESGDCVIDACVEGFLDTNGTVSDGCEEAEGCTPTDERCCDGAERPCGVEQGACERGLNHCVGGQWDLTCVGEVRPANEICNGVDDNCNGAVDEDLTRSCGNAVGQCEEGIQTCSEGDWGSCDGETASIDELCNGLDDDCDGAVDDGVADCCDGHPADEGCCMPNNDRECGISEGECRAGTERCGDDNQWGPCEGRIAPTNELCNGLDDDCDGAVDEDLTRPCGAEIGECTEGVEECGNGVPPGEWGECSGVAARAEICNGLDDDCDSIPDEDLANCCNGRPDMPNCCDPGDTRPCGVDTGACELGEETCGDDNQWGSCEGHQGPVDETCNDVDDDCDGAVDEDLERSCGTNTGECRVGVQLCIAGSWDNPCSGVLPSEEVCDGLNNDCDEDGADEGLANCCNGHPQEAECCEHGNTRPCGVDTGACELGEETCVNGQWSGACEGGVEPAEERCNPSNVDEDCDGEVDDIEFPGLTDACHDGVGVCRREGAVACNEDDVTTSCNVVAGEPSEPDGETLCDGLDNDCDDSVDEGPEGLALSRPCGSNIGECQEGVEICNGAEWGACSGVAPAAELCDDLDNDCDGTVDNQCEGLLMDLRFWESNGDGVWITAQNDRIIVSDHSGNANHGDLEGYPIDRARLDADLADGMLDLNGTMSIIVPEPGGDDALGRTAFEIYVEIEVGEVIEGSQIIVYKGGNEGRDDNYVLALVDGRVEVSFKEVGTGEKYRLRTPADELLAPRERVTIRAWYANGVRGISVNGGPPVTAEGEMIVPNVGNNALEVGSSSRTSSYGLDNGFAGQIGRVMIIRR